MKMDYETFGNSGCHVVLIDLLNCHNDNKLSRKIGQTLSKFSYSAKQISKMSDVKLAEHLLWLLKEHYIQKVSKFKSRKPYEYSNDCVIRSHTLCCINATYTDYLKIIKENRKCQP